MTQSNQYDRLWVAVVTPLLADETINEEGFRKLLRYFIDAHSRNPDLALIVNPEAGDVVYLAPEEQLRVLSIALEETAGKGILVFTGLFANSTRALAKIAAEVGKTKVDGLFAMPPTGSMDITIAWDAARYPEVWADVISAIAKAAPNKPIICHPTASPSAAYGIGLPVEAMLFILKKFPQIVGWKMTYNYEGYRKISRAIKSLDRHVAILGACANYFHENLATGDFDGTVTGAFNYALEPMLAHINAWKAGDFQEARKIWDGGLAELHEYVYETWGRLHVRYKAATWLRGVVDTPFLRSPMPKPRKFEVENIYKILTRMDVSVISRAEFDKVLAELD